LLFGDTIHYNLFVFCIAVAIGDDHVAAIPATVGTLKECFFNRQRWYSGASKAKESLLEKSQLSQSRAAVLRPYFAVTYFLLLANMFPYVLHSNYNGLAAAFFVGMMH
jgi:hypothetical protein